MNTIDNKYRNYIGRVNKFLHWKDIEYWKSVNINTLDWGGVDFKEEKGISSFKQGFGGELVTYYNINIAIYKSQKSVFKSMYLLPHL